MDNYNPRQPTSFRFKDSREIEKFKFIAGDFAFATETLENVSQDKTWKKLINILVEYTHTNGPLIIYDFLNENVFVGYLEGGSYSGYSNNGNTQLVIDLSYDPTTDKLQIEYTEEEMLSADNVKTLFGNQSIIGQGNIDLYRHELVISHQPTDNMPNKYEVYLTYYSSNSLKIDSIQDLTTLIKPSSGKKLFGVVLSTVSGEPSQFSTEHIGIVYQSTIGGNVWQILNANDGVSDIVINNVSDTVTSI